MSEGAVVTSCEDCIWAEYKSGTQTGCKFGRLKKFQERGVKVKLNMEEEDNGLTKNYKNFYTIDRFCNYCRDSEWAAQYDDPHDKVLEQGRIQYDVILPIMHHEDPKYVADILRDVLNDDFKPNTIHMAFPEGIAIAPFLKYFNEEMSGYCQFYYSQVAEDDFLSLVNHGVRKCTGMYYLVIDIDNYASLPEDWQFKVNDVVNKELMPLLLVKPNVAHEDRSIYNGLLVNLKVHNTFGGNSNKGIDEKIVNLVEEQEVENCIFEWSEI